MNVLCDGCVHWFCFDVCVCIFVICVLLSVRALTSLLTVLVFVHSYNCNVVYNVNVKNTV